MKSISMKIGRYIDNTIWSNLIDIMKKDEFFHSILNSRNKDPFYAIEGGLQPLNQITNTLNT